MKISLLSFVSLLHVINGAEVTSQLKKYLEERAKVVEEKLNRHSRNSRNFYNVKLNEVNKVELIGNYSSGEIFTFFDTPYVLMDQDLYVVSQSSYSMVDTFLPNEEAEFLQAKQFKTMCFVMFVTKLNILHIFGFTKESKKFHKIQNIIQTNISDATFFEHQNDLYLVISNYKKQDPAIVVVYKFVDSHFDESEKFFASSATKLHTFHNNGNEVIIVLEEFGETSTLYQFNNNGVRKIQKIDTVLPECVLSYVYRKKRYVIIFDGNHDGVKLYLWTGTALIFWEQFTTSVVLKGKKEVTYLNNEPYLFVSDEKSLWIFSLTNDQISLIPNSAFSPNLTNIWSYYLNYSNTIVTLGPTVEKTVEIVTFSISVEENESEEKVVEEDQLSNCFSNLEKAVYLFRNKLTIAKNQSSTVLREAAVDKSRSKLPIDTLEDLQAKFFIVKSAIKSNESNSLIINETLTINFPLKASKVVARDVRFDELNNQKWQPDRWLSYTFPQNISGLVKAQLVQTNNLKISHNKSLFHNLLLRNGNQIVSGSVHVQNLQTTRIQVDSVNNVSVQDICYKSKPTTIEGLKSFSELKATNLKSGSINGIDSRLIMSILTNPEPLKYIFDVNLKVDNLWVKNINEVDIEKLKQSVFRFGITDSIDGSLTFASVQAREMIFGTLQGKSNFLTVATDQTINSSLTISKIYTGSIETKTINGIDFKNSVATLDDRLISGPVSILKLNVTHNLTMEGNVDRELLQFNNTHIVGTNESDFLQRYNGKIKIRGNLFLKNFDLGKSAKIEVSGTEFDPRLDRFWTKSTHQAIPTHFEAQNGASTPHLFTTLMNGVSVDDYMSNSTQQTKPAKFYFESVIVKGNVMLNPSKQHLPDLRRIQKDSVKVNGTFHIKGLKNYSSVLKVDNLEVNFLNGANRDDDHSVLSDSQRVQNLHIRGDLHVEKLTVEAINNVQLESLIENSLHVDGPQNLHKLNFANVTVKNLIVTSLLNGHEINEVILKINNTNKIDKIRDVHIDSTVKIKNVQNLSTINGLEVEQLMRNSRSEFVNNTIFGDIKFSSAINVRDLHVIVINDIDFRKLSRRILYKSWNQIITEHFKFVDLKSANLITERINDFCVQNPIDISSPESQTVASKNLTAVRPIKAQNLFANVLCDIEECLRNLRNPPTQVWDNVLITGNVTFWDEQSLVRRILSKVVTTQYDNLITAKVTFVNHICANNVSALKTINNIDMKEIIEDAFLNKPDTKQIVKGKKVFGKLEAENLIGLQNTNVTTINDIAILKINDNIVSKNSDVVGVVKGKKVFFGGLQAKKIETEVVSGVKWQDLVSYTNDSEIPSTMFQSVSVKHNFNVKLINNMPFDVLLNERVLKESPKQILTGNYFFRDVKFKGDVWAFRINDVEMANVVYDGKTQIIESPKKFVEDLTIVGNVKAEFINGLKLSESYEQAVLKNEKTNFTGTVVVLKPASLEGRIDSNYINNVPVESVLNTNTKQFLTSEARQINKITQQISDFVNKYLNTTIRMPAELMYLEKSADLQISVPNTISAQIVKTRDDILVHIEGEEGGKFCGLPMMCKCPVQQTMQISSEHSVNTFINKQSQRIYSYYDDNIIINFISNSISTDSYCRTSKTKVMNEVSSLTWNTIPRDDNTGGFFVHQAFFNGYISGVKFFTIYDTTYVVVGVYYDSVLDTHNVNSLVLRFNEDRTGLEEIQKIPTVGAKTISLFPTAQGIVLIIGNLLESRVNTKILRFDEQKQQFELLREAPTFGSLFAEGVVLETDSLIILANERSSLQILKYHPEFDNYYFYQSLQLDYPISSMSVFYADDFGISDAYLSVVTTNDKYFIYSFQFIEGWKLESTGALDGIKSLVPFKLNNKSYLLAPSSNTSCLLTFVEHDLY